MHYVVNKNAQPTGEHEVHVETCTHCPAYSNRLSLGDFTSCWPAIREAKKHFSIVDACLFCCRECQAR